MKLTRKQVDQARSVVESYNPTAFARRIENIREMTSSSAGPTISRETMIEAMCRNAAASTPAPKATAVKSKSPKKKPSAKAKGKIKATLTPDVAAIAAAVAKLDRQQKAEAAKRAADDADDSDEDEDEDEALDDDSDDTGDEDDTDEKLAAMTPLQRENYLSRPERLTEMFSTRRTSEDDARAITRTVLEVEDGILDVEKQKRANARAADARNSRNPFGAAILRGSKAKR